MTLNMNKNDIAIVLTGTIIPNSTFVAISNPNTRKNEYLTAIHYYRQFAPVFFLENSSYSLMSDPDFTSIPGLFIRKLPPSIFFEKGKGFQEFEMIDNWLKIEENIPSRWIKITGRYLYLNFNLLYEECLRENFYNIIIDKTKIFKLAHTCLFYTATKFYKENFLEIHQECDDRIHECIEKKFYERILRLPQRYSRIFSIEPKLEGISGSTGKKYGQNSQIYRIKSTVRKLTYTFDKHFIWHSRWQS
jgi:hypothetical protein